MKRTIFLAILTFSFLITIISAQTVEDRVIVKGDPVLTQSMVDKSRDMFEFMFGGAMTDAEKAEYQNKLAWAWRANDTGTIKAIQDLIIIHDKAVGLSREQLLSLQKEMQPAVNEIRSQADKDQLAKLLTGVHDRVQGLNAKQGGNLPQPNDARQQNVETPVSNGSVPREILGEWIESHSTGTTYTNGYGGYSPAGGEKIIMHFYADGTYKAAYFVQSSMSVGCTMNVYMPSTGVFSVEGNTLKLNEKTSRTISKDTCTARYNYEKDNAPGTYAYPARLERDENGTKIVLTMSDGAHNFYFNTGQSLLGGQ